MTVSKKKVSLLLFGIMLIASVIIWVSLFSALHGSKEKKFHITIQKGDTLRHIATKLEKKNIIQSAKLFLLATRLLGKASQLKSGEYVIRGKFSLYGLIQKLNQGRSVLIRVTIPEGYRMKDIFLLIKAKGIKNSGKYLSLVKDQKFINSLSLPIQVNSLEGLLFPDTYFFSKETSEKKIIKTMVQNFLQKIPSDYEQRSRKVGLSYYKAIVLASIIEKETGASIERKTISSVFHNRMKKRMRLETDPTVIYGIKNFNGNLTRKHLRTWTPYNTYRIRGLPPTPIASPGLHALIAAIKPSQTKYLFFVAKGNGRHQFSTNLRSHNSAVHYYQRQHRKKKYRSY